METQASYLLSALDLYNWGPFAGRHRVEIDPQGSAIIGATGSGKTTLVDALMTLICERPKYNLASTGGHESDRDWVSYVRGKSGEGNTLDDSHIARPGKTVSALAAGFGNGTERILIGGIFWLEGTTSSQSDLKRVWLIDRSDSQDLDSLLELHDQGGYRALKQQEKVTPNLSITKSKAAYVAQLQRFFGVGENAFTLLNRAAGLKQLNSIDQLFRELVLDDNAAFERAGEVVKGFDTLTNIHEELLTARRQHASLLPIKSESDKQQKLTGARREQQRLLGLIPVWYAERRQQMLQAQAAQLQQRLAGLQVEITDLEHQAELARQEEETERAAYLAAGGGDLEELQRTLERLRTDRRGLVESAEQYQKLMRRLELDERLDTATFSANQGRLAEKHDQLQETLEQQKGPWHQAITQLHNLKSRQQETREQLRQVAARPSSNIPPRHDAMRRLLAEQLQLSADELPFLAELVEVKSEHTGWRGAIERAIGAHRLRILVPEALMEPALRWVNDRDNRLDVRLLEVTEESRSARFMEDGFTRKLRFKTHPHREAAKRLLAGIDRHCVDSPQTLRRTEHGLTRQGLMSGRRGYFEKRDGTPLNQNWMTGFDNRDRLAQLQRDLESGEDALRAAETELREAEQTVRRTETELAQLQQLRELSFEQIDVAGCEQEIARYELRVQRLLEPDSDTERARRRWEASQKRLRTLTEQSIAKRAEQQSLSTELAGVQRKQRQARTQIGKGLSGEERDWLGARLAVQEKDDPDSLIEREREQTLAANQALAELGEKIGRSEKALVRQMEQAQKADTGALAEAGTDLQDIPEYLERLQTLTREALPEKEKRFLNYLRDSSDESVTQLLSGVENEVATIEERIEELNATMDRVDFHPGRYLRLEPQRVQHESIRTLTRAQRHLNSARLKDDKGESHYKALQAVVALVRDAAENRRKVGSRALLDPRYRLQFKASVIEREAQRVISTFGGSQGGSGGEKEIIASYILTASLSYALCPPGALRPLFGTIVLDEAFSKSSQAVAGRIVSALREFGLHPLFVTPNKEMQLLRTHTRSAVLIHRKGREATTTSMSWEALRDKALQVRERGA